MQDNIFQELCQTEKSTKKLSIFEKNLFPNIELPHRSNSEQKSILNINSSIDIDDNQLMKNTSNDLSIAHQENPIIQKKNENEKEYYEPSSEPKIFNQIKQSIKKNNQISPNFMNFNFYGFKGRSPYSSQNINNMISNNSSNSNINTNKNGNNKSQKINQKQNQNQINKNQKRNEAALITQLKDKILEYRCSVCNFIANESQELHEHLTLKNHYTFPKKMKKNKKQKVFYKQENKLNQTFIFSINKINKKNFSKKIYCRHCGKKFDSMHGLNAHLNAHKYKCELCHKLFNSKEELTRHIHLEFFYNNKKGNMFNKKRDYKSPGKKVKMVIDDWEDISSNKKEKWESDEESNKNDFEQSYAFIGDNDENFDFNKMVKINDKRI